MAQTYRRRDGSEASIVLGKPVDADSHSPIHPGVWESVFQMGDVRVRKLGKRITCAKKIYGKIYLHHSYGIWNLYNREEEEAETVDVPGVITLTPPTFGILPYDQVFISFDMASGLEGMKKHSILWIPQSTHNKVRKVRARGRRWATEVSYIVFTSAVLADIEIELLNFEKDHEEGIYGSITASFTDEKFGLEPLYMFKRRPIDPLHVKAGKALPLSRPFIAVPRNNALNINVDLHTRSGAPIAGGIINVRPDSLGWWFGILGGKDDGIQVRAKVDFCPFHKHTFTKSVCHRDYDDDDDDVDDDDTYDYVYKYPEWFV